MFLFGDSWGVTVAGQKLPDGYHLDRMLTVLIHRGGLVGCWGTCLDARGLGDVALVEGPARGTLKECTDWTLYTDKVLAF